MSENLNLNLEIRDEAIFRETYPKLADKVDQLISVMEIDISTFVFEHCAVYEVDPYTFVIVFIGMEDSDEILIVSLEYSPDGSLVGVTAELDAANYDFNQPEYGDG